MAAMPTPDLAVPYDAPRPVEDRGTQQSGRGAGWGGGVGDDRARREREEGRGGGEGRAELGRWREAERACMVSVGLSGRGAPGGWTYR